MLSYKNIITKKENRGMDKLLILKLSDTDRTIPFGDKKGLLERANGAWRISLNRIKGVKKALLLFRGRVLAEYEIGSKIIVTVEEVKGKERHRLTFDMKEVENSVYKDRILDYRTANPASVLDVGKIKYRKDDVLSGAEQK